MRPGGALRAGLGIEDYLRFLQLLLLLLGLLILEAIRSSFKECDRTN